MKIAAALLILLVSIEGLCGYEVGNGEEMPGVIENGQSISRVDDCQNSGQSYNENCVNSQQSDFSWLQIEENLGILFRVRKHTPTGSK